MFKKEVALKGKRLTLSNLQDYIEQEYGIKNYQTQQGMITFTPLLQKDYGGENDCTLTSITAIWKHFCKKEIDVIYNTVAKIAEKYFYNPDKYGTIPLFIDNICNDLLKVIKIPSATKWVSEYGKGLKFDYDDIMDFIKKQKPIILNITDDGRSFYSCHSVVVIGYYICKKGNRFIRFLQIYDNWSKSISLVDYEKLNKLCSINHF